MNLRIPYYIVIFAIAMGCAFAKDSTRAFEIIFLGIMVALFCIASEIGNKKKP
jgi:hypothetical protein